MRWISWLLLMGLFFTLAAGGPGAAAGEDGESARSAVLERALDLLRVRLEARLGEAEALKALGRFEEALDAYRSIDELHTEGLAQVERWLARLDAQPAAAPGVTPPPPRGAGDVPFQAPPPDARVGPARRDGAAGAFAGRGSDRSLRSGDSARSQIAVEHALRWLAAHQSPNGGWEAAGFGTWCDGKPASQRPDGAGKDHYDPGVTGLALCAFLGAGYTNRGKHPFAKTVSKGLRYLKNIQDQEGCFGPRSTQHYIYNHAVASLAMVEAYGMTQSPIFKGSAQRALDFLALARNPYFVWRYGVKPGDNDTSVTGWAAMALESASLINESAKRADKAPPLVIDEAAFEGVRAWLDKMTDPDYGRVGYIQRGGGPARPQELIDRFPADKSEAMTAVGILLRMFLGEDPRTSTAIQKGAALCAAQPPVWNPADGSIDMYYWYYGTLAMFQVGGPGWKLWNEQLEKAVAATQRTDTDYCLYKGSWDPVGPWGPDGGRVYATALLTLCMEVYYRYDRVFGTGPN